MSQSLNRYSYVMNNPLSLIDPSGYSWLSKAFRSIGKFFSTYWKPIVAIIAAVVTYGAVTGYYAAAAGSATGAAAGSATYAAAASAAATSVGTMATAGAAAGFVAGAITGGVKGAIVGAISGALFGAIGGYYKSTWNVGRVLAEGAIGGVSSELGGGSFRDGFLLSAGISGLRWGARTMRQEMSENWSKNEYARDSAQSDGWYGDMDKHGGGRPPESLRGQNLTIDKAKSAGWGCSAFGCQQAGQGRLFGVAYSGGGWADHLVEAYAGPHDWLSSFRYTSDGFLKTWNLTQRALFGAYSAVALIPATGFVGADVVPGIVYSDRRR